MGKRYQDWKPCFRDDTLVGKMPSPVIGSRFRHFFAVWAAIVTLILSRGNLPASEAMRLPIGNRAIISSLKELPKEGGYATSPESKKYLERSLGMIREGIKPPSPGASFCSSATYIALAAALKKMELAGRLSISEDCWENLMETELSDGHGAWGMWNANGPGAARLLGLAGLGYSFTDLASALPGDFLKFFWTPKIGRDEKGHLVVFLGSRESGGKTMIRYWSSNRPDGMGVNETPFDEMHNLIFSRLSPTAGVNIPPPWHEDEISQKMKEEDFSESDLRQIVRPENIAE